MEPSYASGTSSTPLLGDTIGDNLDRTIERFGDREALVSVHQDLRYTYAQFGEAVDRARGRSSRPASSPATASASGARTAPSGRSCSTRRPRPGSSWSTSTRPTGRPSSSTCCASRAAGCWSPRPRSSRPTTCRWSPRCATTWTASSGWSSSDATGRSSSPAASACRAEELARAPGRDAVRRPDQHPVHERHHGLPQGRDAQPPQHPQQRLLRRRGLRLHARRTGSASRCPSTTASAW